MASHWTKIFSVKLTDDIRVSLSLFNGAPFLDIRRWRGSNPTRIGVAFSTRECGHLRDLFHGREGGQISNIDVTFDESLKIAKKDKKIEIERADMNLSKTLSLWEARFIENTNNKSTDTRWLRSESKVKLWFMALALI